MRDVLFGKFHGQSRLQQGDQLIRITPDPKGAAAPSPLLPTLEIEGAFGVVRGELVDGTLFDAALVEVVPPILSSVLDGLLENQTLDRNTLRPLVGESLARLTGTGPPEPPAGLSLTDPDDDDRPLCALVVGHRAGAKGAASQDGSLTEFDFNLTLADEISSRIEAAQVEIVLRDDVSDGLARLPAKVNALGPDFVVSLHCNSFTNPAVTGTETLYFESSNAAHRLAKTVQRHLVTALGLRNRHTKPRSAGELGGVLLANTHAPSVIGEPFFISNDKDIERALSRREALAQAYASAIDEAAEGV